MIKQNSPFLSLTLLFVLSCSKGYTQEYPVVFIERHITHVLASNEYIVEETIHKSNISGFAKYTVVLTSGPKINFTIIEDGKSTVRYDDATGRAKFIWVSFPTAEAVTISYKLSGFDKINTSYEGEFKYISDNVARTIYINVDNCSYSEQ